MCQCQPPCLACSTLRRKSGVATVVASHDRSSLEVLCDRVFEFEGSSLVEHSADRCATHG